VQFAVSLRDAIFISRCQRISVITIADDYPVAANGLQAAAQATSRFQLNATELMQVNKFVLKTCQPGTPLLFKF
jgi:hypothetical protein